MGGGATERISTYQHDRIVLFCFISSSPLIYSCPNPSPNSSCDTYQLCVRERMCMLLNLLNLSATIYNMGMIMAAFRVDRINTQWQKNSCRVSSLLQAKGGRICTQKYASVAWRLFWAKGPWTKAIVKGCCAPAIGRKKHSRH